METFDCDQKEKYRCPLCSLDLSLDNFSARKKYCKICETDIKKQYKILKDNLENENDEDEQLRKQKICINFLEDIMLKIEGF